MQIGFIELFWRRGCIDPSLPKSPADSEARAIAKNTPCFKHEPSEIELTMKMYGVDISCVPKSQCELAVRGVECLWAVSKIHFRSIDLN